MNHQVVTDYTNVNTENSSVCVYVRARPPDPSWTLEDDDASVEDKFQNPLQATLAGLSPKSNSGGQSPAPQATSSAFITNFPDNPKKICIKDPAAQGAVKHHGEIYFSFDKVFWTECSQEEIFQAVAKPQVENLITGFNGCCFAYGQTGSGKTYSMFGEGAGNSRGMIPRCMEEVFVQLDRKSKDKEVAVVVSFLEIYCDRVRDLGEAFMSHGDTHRLRTTSDVHQKMKSSRAESFQPRNKHGSGPNSNHPGAGSNGGVWDSYPSMDLKIHEDVQGNVFVKDLSLIPVTTLEEVLEIISLGLKVRATHETKMNQVSSRSHTVFTVTVVQRDPYTDETMTGILNLVDLAGSERLKKSASEGQRKTEALHINSSLTALGKVVMALDPSSGLTHVPYRDSKLTRLLQNSLGGNSFTVVLATVHPIARFSEECLSTLQFANRCRSVHNNPRVNKLGDGLGGDQRKMKKLQDEIQALRSRLGNGGAGPGGVTEDANSRVMAVLAQMGLEGASQLPNGSIRLPDGRIVGNFGLDGGGSGGDASNGSASGGGGAGGREAYTSAILRGVPSNVRTMVQGLEGEVRGVKKKLKERKKELLSIQGQLEARRAGFVESETQSKRRETELAGQLAVAQAQLVEVRAAAARSKDEQLEAVLAGSQALLRRQRRMLLKATGHSSTHGGPQHETDLRAQGATRERKEEEARHAQSLRALVFSKEVETENLRQKYEQLVQAEADGRAVTKAKLEKFRAHRDREVQDLSAELLLLHDHVSSLREDVQAAGLASSCPLEADFSDGNPINANSPPNQSSPLVAALLPHSASLPHLSRLLKARGVASSPSYQSSNDRCLAHSQSETVIVQSAGIRHSNGGRRRGGQTTTAAARARARPQSAGVARRWPGNTSSRHALGQASEAGRGVGPAPATRTKNNAARDVGLPRGAGRIRPMSAPGRRPEGKQTPGGPQLVGPVEVNTRGEGHQEGVGHPIRTMLGGWSAQDVLDRNAGDLSRGGLLCLVRALRENLCAGDGHNQAGGPANHGAPQLGGNHVPEVSEGAGGVRPDAQLLLREQTRRYNDLRVAHASLCRRLEKGERGVGSRSAGIGPAGQAKLSSARRDCRELGAKTKVKPETNVGCYL